MKGITVVICSYNGRQRLETTLVHLLAQKYSPDLCLELVFVDNRSTDGTYEFVERYFAVVPDFLSVKILREARPGKAYALELAYDAATYDYIVTCDDDNWLCPDYIQTAHDLMESLPQVGLIGCQTIGVFEGPVPSWFQMVSANYVVGKQLPGNGFFEDQRDFVWGAGMVLRKSIWIFLRENKFEFVTGKNVKKAVGEDTELSILFKALGYRFYYSEALILHHYIPQKRLLWDNCIQVYRGFGSTKPYYILYKQCLSGKMNVLFFRAKWSLYYLYRIFRILVESRFAVVKSNRFTEGYWLKLKYTERLASLRELLLSRDFNEKMDQIKLFVTRIKSRTDIGMVSVDNFFETHDGTGH